MEAPSPSVRHVLRRALEEPFSDGRGRGWNSPCLHAAAKHFFDLSTPTFATQESIVYAHPCLRARRRATALSTVRAMTDRGGRTDYRTNSGIARFKGRSVHPASPCGCCNTHRASFWHQVPEDDHNVSFFERQGASPLTLRTRWRRRGRASPTGRGNARSGRS